MRNFISAIIVILLILSCGTTKKPSYSDNYRNWSDQKLEAQKKIVHTLFLAGDTGEIDDQDKKTNTVTDAIKVDISKTEGETSLVFLGDNIYPHGMPKKKDTEKRKKAEAIINAQLDCATEHGGRTYFIPGNHDWNKHKPGGRKAIKRQEDYIESYFDEDGPRVNWYPNNACGDPKVVKINKDLVYIFIDSQWWLHNWTKEKKMNHGCDIKSRIDLLKRMEELFVEHKNDEIVVLMHHPLKSDGMHGGKFGLKQHLFPLTEWKDNLWIPLPVLGSLHPAYRNLTGSPQDVTNVKNQELMHSLQDIALEWDLNIIFASGHDHGMQYFDDNKIKYIVSGAGGKIDYIKNGGEADYARSGRGYVKLYFHEDFEIWADYIILNSETGEAEVEFRTQVRAPRAGTIDEKVQFPSITQKTKLIAANEKFAAGPLKKLFMGSQYRDMWATPVEAEVINLETKLGGLTPIKKGGGMASNSLRMEKADGKQYILRSIKKDYTKLVPPEFTNLKLLDVVSDQNSASHPYNAIIIPRLSQAAGIFYTNPKLVYLKHQKGLGNYNSQFPEELYLLEERPSGNWSDAEQFGNASEIIGFADLLEILREKKNHFIDQEWVLKSRIFDLFIHDWDRHDDQWRWAKFKEEGKNIYRPIPRDRDQAFYKFKGIVPWYIANFIEKKFKTIKEDCKDVKRLAFNARYFDRYYMHDLEWKEWEQIISQMQKDITDNDIEDAIQKFPKEIMSLDDDEELTQILKGRRNNLMKIGRRLYDFLSREVEITGSDNKDDFLISRKENGSVEVTVSVDSKDHGTLTKYKRIFYPNETKEIRLFGLRGKDQFLIEGADNNSIKVRIIGGEDDDTIKNETRSTKVYGYDDIKGMSFEGKVIDKRSTDLEVNEYDRYGFLYDSNFPILTFGNSVDDGWWFGGSINWIKQGWRKVPYKSRQNFSISVAPGSRNAVRVGYDGHFPNTLGSLDFAPDISLNFPQYENYFGLGNNTKNDLNRQVEYNWVRMQSIDVNPRLQANIGNSSSVRFGPLFQYRNIENSEGRVSDDSVLGFSENALVNRRYFGGDIIYNLGFNDNAVNPTNGFNLNFSMSHLVETSKEENVTLLSADAQFYFKIASRPRVVFATQLGYEKAYGDLQFYHNPDLGNNSGLRGFRNERFRGDVAFYHNMDLRIKLFNWNNTFLPMDVGLLGGYDYGRVSLDGNTADLWHDSQTVGIWFELLGAMVLQPYYSFNDEQNTFSLQVGFNF